MTTDTPTDAFEEHRPVLMGVAYRMLGRVADAEDVVQDAWLRWSAADRTEVREPRAYLVRVTTRLAIDRLRQVKARGEAYVGPWLPEPYVTDFGDTVPDTAERAVLADSVSLAVLVVLESLSPLERAVFVLRRRSATRTPTSRPCWTAASRLCANSPDGPANTSTNGARATRSTLPNAAISPSGSSPLRPRETWRASWRCSPRTSV